MVTSPYADDNLGTSNMTPAELRAYFKGLKRGMTITYVSMTVRDATQQAYTRFPHIKTIVKDPAILAQEFMNTTFERMKQPIPTPQEMTLNDLTMSETSLQLLAILTNMQAGFQQKKKDNTAVSNNNNNGMPRRPSLPPPPAINSSANKGEYNREKAEKNGAFKYSKEEIEGLR